MLVIKGCHLGLVGLLNCGLLFLDYVAEVVSKYQSLFDVFVYANENVVPTYMR